MFFTWEFGVEMRVAWCVHGVRREEKKKKKLKKKILLVK